MLIKADVLSGFIAEIFSAAGCSSAEAERIGRRLVGANLAGHDSHGVVRCHRYVDWLADGVQIPDAEITVVSDTGGMAVLDGNFGMGQTVGEQAVQYGIDKAKAEGTAIIGLRHAGHIGRVGDWGEMAAEAGLVSIHFVNVAAGRLVAPFGAIDRRMGTNPICISIPRSGDNPPVLLDFATSVVAEGKALVAYQGGPSLPDGALIAPDGSITSDPTALYGQSEPGKFANARDGEGALRAMGDHKGSGLAMICELLAGVLLGSGTAESPRFCNGMLSIYLSPDRFVPGNEFADGVTGYLDWFKSARPAQGHDEVLSPGEPERRRRADRLANGLTLPDDIWESILTAARKAGVAEDRVAEVAASV